MVQIVSSDGHENGQKEMEDDDDDEEEPKWTGGEKEMHRKQESSPDASIETQEGDSKKGNSLICFCYSHISTCFFYNQDYNCFYFPLSHSQ